MYSDAKIHVFRLKPHEDLKRGILAFATANSIEAGVMLTCVGSLEKINLRFANQKAGSERSGYFEIIHCVGMISLDMSCHLHLTVADGQGVTSGGHLLDNNLIYTTAEIAIAELTNLAFDRQPDETYGYRELVIRKKEKKS
jgi:uncharacterized protein